MLPIKIIHFLYAIVSLTNSARILGVFQVPSYSHYQLGHILLKELAEKGHDVTMLSPYKEKEKVENLRTIFITSAQKKFEDLRKNLFAFAKSNMILNIVGYSGVLIPLIENTLNDTNVQKLIKSNEKFDIVILEKLYNEALHGFCAHFQAHCIILSPVPLSSWINSQMGNSGSPSYMPDIHSRYSSKMSFYERVVNAFGYVFASFWFHVHTLPAHNAVMNKYFSNIPHLHDIYHNVSLSLLNSHVSTNPATPLLPNMIDIGGYHIKPPKPLASDLKEFMDTAKEGVVYFNMGSVLQSQNLAKLKREAILKSFSRLKQTILWKWENETLPDQASNVKLLKWIPQNDLLAHPNIKAFITHGGLLSVLEAVYHGVPIIGIPVYGDQYTNTKNAEENGQGIAVPYEELNEQNFGDALNEVLNNPKYRNNAKLRSKIMRDNQMKQLDKAVFWIEYVLRHNGAHHLQSAALPLTWYQYLLLDVIAFWTVLVFIPISVCCYLYRLRKTIDGIKEAQHRKRQ